MAVADHDGLQKRPIIVAIGTGGTIAQVGQRDATLGIGQILAAVPAISRIADLRMEQLCNVASTRITGQHWLEIANRLNAQLSEDDVAGAVVTHGTDTLEETAYFLNLTVNSTKPVVVVGAMRDAAAISADGPGNVRDAVTVAASRLSHGRGVLVCLNNSIDAARDVTKAAVAGVQAFRSPASGPLGTVRDGVVRFDRTASRLHTHLSEFSVASISSLPRVGIVYSHVDADGGALDGLVAAGANGIVIAGTGNGGLAPELDATAAVAARKGIAIVRSSRTGSGTVIRNKEVDDDRLGFIAAGDLNPQKARVLLMLALTRTREPGALQAMFDKY